MTDRLGIIVHCLRGSVVYRNLEPCQDPFLVISEEPTEADEWLHSTVRRHEDPMIEELFRSEWRLAVPEFSEVFLEKVCAHDLEVHAKQVSESSLLLVQKVPWILEPEVARAGEDLGMSLAHLPGLHLPDLVDGFEQVADDVELVEDEDRLGHSSLDDVNVRSPHVAADSNDPGRPFWPPVGEELLQGRSFTSLTAPEEALVDEVVDLGVVDVAALSADLVDPENEYALVIAVEETVLDGLAYSRPDRSPGDAELSGNDVPCEELCERGEDGDEGYSERTLARRPWDVLDLDATFRAVHPDRLIEDDGLEAPEWYVTPSALREVVSNPGSPSAMGARQPSLADGLDEDEAAKSFEADPCNAMVLESERDPYDTGDEHVVPPWLPRISTIIGTSRKDTCSSSFMRLIRARIHEGSQLLAKYIIIIEY